MMELKGTRVLVVGLGESGLAMAKWLHRQGAHVRVADSRDNPPNLEALALVAPTAEVIAGPFASATFAGIDLVALSPGCAQGDAADYCGQRARGVGNRTVRRRCA
jgi:UDP-N-acetylmuramoylalanine--D-glutamate ligase